MPRWDHNKTLVSISIYKGFLLKSRVMTANNNKKSGNGIGVGAALGVAFGSVYGNKYGNLSQSIALGLAIGVAVGAIFDGFIKKK